MKTSTKRKLLVAGVSTAIALVALEVSLRMGGHAPMDTALGGKGQVLRTSDDPLLGYELTPDSEGEGWGTYVEINSHGFRDEDYALEKGEHLRICVIGDSITFGNHLKLEETYAEVLEKLLRERALAPEVQVLNLGVGGYDTMQEVAMLEHTGIAFDPELVVVGFCVNDLGIVSVTMEHSWSERDRSNPLYLSRIAQAVRAFSDERTRRREAADWNDDAVYARAFAGQMAGIEDDADLQELLKTLHLALRTEREAGTEPSALARRIPPRWFVSKPRLERFAFALDRLQALSQQHGFRTAMVVVPYLDPVPAFEHVYDIVRHMAERRGIEVLEVKERFDELGLVELRIDADDPVHPDARGHEVLAERLFEYVESLDWIPDAN